MSGSESYLLELGVAGIMSSADGFVKETLGSQLSAPFMTLSFMALLVIPEIKLSDKGLFDGRSFHFIASCKEN